MSVVRVHVGELKVILDAQRTARVGDVGLSVCDNRLHAIWILGLNHMRGAFPWPDVA
jgi:hypothetical protein